MQITVYKTYSRVVHSYLAVFKIEAAASTADPAVFVVKDRQAEIGPDWPASSSSEASETASSSICPSNACTGIGCSCCTVVEGFEVGDYLESRPTPFDAKTFIQHIVETHLGRTMDSFCPDPLLYCDFYPTTRDGRFTMCEKPPTYPPYPDPPGMYMLVFDVCCGFSEAPPPFEVFPHRTLVSIASLTDLLVIPASPAEVPEVLYRAPTVALLFRSHSHMEATISKIVQDLKTNARLQRSTVSNVEILEVTDPGYGANLDTRYYFL